MLTGKLWAHGGWNDLQPIRKNNTRVTLGGVLLQSTINHIRDWCQDNFGDNWIYEWNDFYFKNELDALMFTLRWVGHEQ